MMMAYAILVVREPLGDTWSRVAKGTKAKENCHFEPCQSLNRDINGIDSNVAGMVCMVLEIIAMAVKCEFRECSQSCSHVILLVTQFYRRSGNVRVGNVRGTFCSGTQFSWLIHEHLMRLFPKLILHSFQVELMANAAERLEGRVRAQKAGGRKKNRKRNRNSNVKDAQASKAKRAKQ